MKSKHIIFLVFLALLVSCKTYIISVESFSQQMVDAKSETLKEVEINNPSQYMYGNIRYLANNIESIVVIDKNGKEIVLKNSPKLEMIVIRKNGKKNVLLFDTVILENDTLKGMRSRLFHTLTREIPLNDIEGIKIQDSGKAYKYQ